MSKGRNVPEAIKSKFSRTLALNTSRRNSQRIRLPSVAEFEYACARIEQLLPHFFVAVFETRQMQLTKLISAMSLLSLQ